MAKRSSYGGKSSHRSMGRQKGAVTIECEKEGRGQLQIRAGMARPQGKGWIS